MTKQLSNLIHNKRVLLLGFGMEGRSAYRLLKETGSYVTLDIADLNPVEDIDDCKIHSGAGYLESIKNYDIVFKSPGIVLPREYREKAGCTVTSQTEVFLSAYRQQVIGITGTKGKSTVATLLHHVLKENNIPAVLGGNIGKPVFDIISEINKSSVIVLELSSHQLEFCSVSPAVAVFLNIFEDHLDHYGTFEYYIKAKKNIYLHQNPDDVLYCGRNAVPPEGEAVSRVVVADEKKLPLSSFEEIGAVKLRGRHNLTNCAFVYNIAKTYGIKDEEFIAALRTYTPLRHRLEFIGCHNSVDYYDDSISTTVQSTISAATSIPNASTLLLGGMDRGIDYTGLINYLAESGLSNIICMYESGKRIYDILRQRPDIKADVYYCEELTVAVNTARQVTAPGGACILSPAAASYGDFTNFEQRGDAFRQLVFHQN